jgi:hypothetical protein
MVMAMDVLLSCSSSSSAEALAENSSVFIRPLGLHHHAFYYSLSAYVLH